jgi:hypothetical protein
MFKFLLKRLRKPMEQELRPKPIRPKAWVIRLPGVFVGYGGNKIKGSFQTIVLAESEDMAWDIAVQHDVWQQLPFEVPNVQIFPRDPAVAP